MAEFKAALHVFWKEDPQELLRADPQSERAKQLIAARGEAEIEGHKSIYLLQSASRGLRETLPSVRVVIRRGSADQEVGPEHLARALAMAELYEQSVMPMYFSLVADKGFSDPKIDPVSFKEEFLHHLGRADAGTNYPLVLGEASDWLDRQLEGPADSQRTPEIIAINFIESFIEVELARVVRQLSDPVLELCRPVIEGTKPSSEQPEMQVA